MVKIQERKSNITDKEYLKNQAQDAAEAIQRYIQHPDKDSLIVVCMTKHANLKGTDGTLILSGNINNSFMAIAEQMLERGGKNILIDLLETIASTIATRYAQTQPIISGCNSTIKDIEENEPSLKVAWLKFIQHVQLDHPTFVKDGDLPPEIVTMTEKEIQSFGRKYYEILRSRGLFTKTAES